MKPVLIAAVALAAIVPAAAQMSPPRPGGGLYLPPLTGFGAPQQRRGNNSVMLEMVPPGQTPQRYDRIVNVTILTVRPGVGSDELLRAFTQRYLAVCPRAQTQAMNLGGGNSGVRIDCTRHPRTGRSETTFARVAMRSTTAAIAAYQTNYFAMPAEASNARNFLGRIAFR